MFFFQTASTNLRVQRPQPIQFHQGEYPRNTSITSQPAITSQLPTSTVMTSHLHHSITSKTRNPYDFPSANSPMHQDLMPNMRLIE